jgi:hypothetical protein
VVTGALPVVTGAGSGTLAAVGVTVASLPPGTGGGRAAAGPGASSTPPGTGAPHGSAVSQASMPSGLSGSGAGMSGASGGGSPGWPALPYGNPGPWAVGGPAAGQGAASGSGHGGAGPVAVLAASLLITVIVLRIRRTNPLRPRSAWLSALEVPG